MPISPTPAIVTIKEAEKFLSTQNPVWELNLLTKRILEAFSQHAAKPRSSCLSLLLYQLVKVGFYSSNDDEFIEDLTHLLKTTDINMFSFIARYNIKLSKQTLLQAISEEKMQELLWLPHPETKKTSILIALEADSKEFVEQYWPEGKVWFETPARIAYRELRYDRQLDQAYTLLHSLIRSFWSAHCPVNPALNILLAKLVQDKFFTSEREEKEIIAKFNVMQEKNDSHILPLVAQYKMPLDKNLMLTILSAESAVEFLEKQKESKSETAISHAKPSAEDQLNKLLWLPDANNQTPVELALIADNQAFIEQYWSEGKAWLETPARAALRGLGGTSISDDQLKELSPFADRLLRHVFWAERSPQNPALNILLAKIVRTNFYLFDRYESACIQKFKTMLQTNNSNILPLVFEYNLPITVDDMLDILSSVSAADFIKEKRGLEEKQDPAVKSDRKAKADLELKVLVNDVVSKTTVVTAQVDAEALMQVVMFAVKLNKQQLFEFSLYFLSQEVEFFKEEKNLIALRKLFADIAALGVMYSDYVKKFGYTFKNDKTIRNQHLLYIWDHRAKIGGVHTLDEFRKQHPGFCEEKEYVEVISSRITVALFQGEVREIQAYGFWDGKCYVNQDNIIKAFETAVEYCNQGILEYVSLQEKRHWMQNTDAGYENKLIRGYNQLMGRKDHTKKNVAEFIRYYALSFNWFDYIKKYYILYWAYHELDELEEHQAFIDYLKDCDYFKVQKDSKFNRFIVSHIDKIMRNAIIFHDNYPAILYSYLDAFSNLRIESVVPNAAESAIDTPSSKDDKESKDDEYVVSIKYLRFALQYESGAIHDSVIQYGFQNQASFDKYTFPIKHLYSKYIKEYIQSILSKLIDDHGVEHRACLNRLPIFGGLVNWKDESELLIRLIKRGIVLGLKDELTHYFQWKVRDQVVLSDEQVLSLLLLTIRMQDWTSFKAIWNFKSASFNVSPLFDFVLDLKSKDENSSVYNNVMYALRQLSEKGVKPTENQRFKLFNNLSGFVIEKQSMPAKKDPEVKEMGNRIGFLLEHEMVAEIKHSEPVAKLLGKLKSRYDNNKAFTSKLKLRAYSREQKLFCIAKLIAALATKDPQFWVFTDQEIKCLTERSKTRTLLREIFPKIKAKNFNELVAAHIEKEAKSESAAQKCNTAT